MKIIFFSDHFYPEMSAPAAHVYERSKIWVQQGHSVTVITNVPNTPFGSAYPGYKNKFRQIEYLDGIRVVRVGTFMAENKGTILRFLDYISYTISALVNSLFEEKPDVVLSTSPHLFVPVAGVIFSKLKHVPHVFEIRDLWPHSIAATTSLTKESIPYRMLEKMELALYRASNRIIAMTSIFKKDLISRGIPEEKIDVVINGANLELFQPRSVDENLLAELKLQDKIVIGYLGTIGMPHGLENAIETAKTLRQSNVAFLFVGEGAGKQKLFDLTKEYELDNIYFVGRQDKEDMPKYWSLCDIALIHLKDDPLFESVIPSKIFESMAMGKPIIYVGPESPGSEIVRDNNAGFVVPAAQPGKFSEAILAFVEQPEKLQEIATNSHNAAPKYSRLKHAENTLNTLAKINGDR